MNKVTKFFIAAFLIICVLSILQRNFLLSSDILLTIPQYAEEKGWERPKNSLLSDPVFQFEPWRIYAKERLKLGELPFINDKNSLGVPFLANQISAIFFPLSILYYFLPASESLFLIHALKLYIMFLFTYLYFRELKVGEHISALGGFFSICLGFMIVWLQWPQTNVFILFPLLLYLTEKLRTSNQNKYLLNIGLSLTYFLIVLAGHPETAFHVAVVHFSYLLFRLRPLGKIIESLIFIFLGLGMGAFLIFPFLEYLSFSHALFARSNESPITLPFYTVIMQLFPFILGAPIFEFYKPVSNSLNFQELVGGYVGLSLLVLGLVSGIKLKCSSLKYFWVFMLLICFSLAYQVLPFSLIGKFPLFDLSANHRAIGFVGYSLIVLSILYISESYALRKPVFKSKLVLLVPITVFFGIVLSFFLPFEKLGFDTRELNFIDFFLKHVLLIILTTILFFVTLNFYLKSRRALFLVLSAITVCFQTLGLFYGYNAFLGRDMYYPRTSLVSNLEENESGVYLEVGNPFLTENLNLVYGFSSIESYDAIAVDNFKRQYDKFFPEKNQWGNPETVSENSLKEFGIKYLISDYDLRLEKSDLHSERDDVLPPLVRGSPIILALSDKDVKGFRILPATFNRHNSCNVEFQVINQNNEVVFKHDEQCSRFYNNMYYSFETPGLASANEDDYYLRIVSSSDDKENTISFYGNGKLPYLAYLKGSSGLGLELLEQSATWYIFAYPEGRTIDYSGRFEVLENLPEKISLLTYSSGSGQLELKRANFQGWQVYVDGKRERLKDTPLLSVDLAGGDHLVEFVYVPYSFYLGLFTSICSLLVLMIYLVRSLLLSSFFGKELSSLFTAFSKKARKLPWESHAIFVVAVGSAAFILASVFLHFFPPSSEFIPTDVINWMNVNKHVKKDDYVYLSSLILGTASITIFSWIIWIKKH